MSKPILLGMNNPQGNRPLWPDPPGCTGWRIWKMLTSRRDVSRRQYLRAFDRRNLLETKVWNAAAARAVRRATLDSLRGRTVAILGGQVAAALGLSLTALQPTWCLEHPDAENRVETTNLFYLIPHPSGLNRWYNDKDNREAAIDLLVSLYDFSINPQKSNYHVSE